MIRAMQYSLFNLLKRGLRGNRIAVDKLLRAVYNYKDKSVL